MTIQEQLAVCENGWQFACDWYTPDQIERGIKGADADRAPPADVQSRAFAEWLTHEYRLAMAKGIQVGRERSAALRKLAAIKELCLEFDGTYRITHADEILSIIDAG